MNKETRQALHLERVKLTMRADVYRSRAKYYLDVYNHLSELSKADNLTGDDNVTINILHFGHEGPKDQVFIDLDLLQDLLKIQANRFWNRHDNAMTAIMKINKVLENGL